MQVSDMKEIKFIHILQIKSFKIKIISCTGCFAISVQFLNLKLNKTKKKPELTQFKIQTIF